MDILYEDEISGAGIFQEFVALVERQTRKKLKFIRMIMMDKILDHSMLITKSKE